VKFYEKSAKIEFSFCARSS